MKTDLLLIISVDLFWWRLAFFAVFVSIAWQLFRLANFCNCKKQERSVDKNFKETAILVVDLLRQKGGYFKYNSDGGFETHLDSSRSRGHIDPKEPRAKDMKDSL